MIMQPLLFRDYHSPISIWVEDTTKSYPEYRSFLKDSGCHGTTARGGGSKFLGPAVELHFF